ncbi:MAG: polyhydroxyalkanoate synthesis protein PhaF, partial [Geodermatophilaceae bacterium]|nr:polyhydroxyalkanoate synthesis protein PhaF [Geodermatophilaceae bacterium]
MVRDAVRGYWALASGLTDVTRQRATSAARALVAQGEATAEQISAIAEDLVSTSVTNRTALVGIVRHEIERARTAMGMPTVAEVEALSRRVAALESALARLRPAPAAKAPAAAKASATKAPATKAPATKAVRKTPAAKTAAATRAPATRAPATKTPAKRATAT